MPNIKLRIGGQWVTIGGGDLVSEANNYTDKQIEAVNASITAVNKDIGNTNDYIDGSFKDGIISQTEAKRIGTYLNTLATDKANLDQRTTDILNNPNLPATRNSSLTAAKSQYDSAYTNLINTINPIVSAGVATATDTTNVDNQFILFNNAVALLTDQLEHAVDEITGSIVNPAQQFSSSYTDAMKATWDMSVTTTQGNITSAKAYIDPVFQGGIIYDSQRTQINSWMTTLDNDKKNMDKNYNIIDGNADLTDPTAKTNLETSYSTFGTDYTNMVNTMNSILNGGSQVTSTQASSFDSALTTYTNDLALLQASGEAGIDSIATTKGNRANANAQAYAAPLKTTNSNLASDVTAKANALQTEVDTDFKDGLITVNEQQAIQTALNNLSSSKSNMDSNYNDIYNDPTNSPVEKGYMMAAKSNYDGAYTTLVNSVNNATADGNATGNEQSTIDNNVAMLNQYVTSLKTAVDNGIDYIAQKKADAAEFAGYSYTDQKLISVDGTITTMQQNIQTNATDITDAKNNIVYKVDIISSNGLVFKNGNVNTILQAQVWYGQTDVTSTTDASKFSWTRTSDDSAGDTTWNSSHGNGVKTIAVTTADVPNNRATFVCSIST